MQQISDPSKLQAKGLGRVLVLESLLQRKTRKCVRAQKEVLKFESDSVRAWGRRTRLRMNVLHALLFPTSSGKRHCHFNGDSVFSMSVVKLSCILPVSGTMPPAPEGQGLLSLPQGQPRTEVRETHSGLMRVSKTWLPHHAYARKANPENQPNSAIWNCWFREENDTDQLFL